MTFQTYHAFPRCRSYRSASRGAMPAPGSPAHNVSKSYGSQGEGRRFFSRRRLSGSKQAGIAAWQSAHSVAETGLMAWQAGHRRDRIPMSINVRPGERNRHLVGWRRMAIAYKLTNATFKSIGQLQALLEQEARDGWTIQGAGPFYLFMAREAGPPREVQVARVLLATMDFSRKLAEHQAQQGWALAALGPSHVYFVREPGKAEPLPLRYRSRSIALMTPGGVRDLLQKEGRDGWTARALTAGSALLSKPSAGAEPIEHALDGTLLRTAGMTQRLLEERAAQGWRVACVSRLFVVFYRAVS